MSKYSALGNFLKNQRLAQIPMTFREIEKVTGTRLPSSKRYPAWWSNNISNNVMTRVWLAAGFRTEQVDTKAERLVFRRVTDAPPARAQGMQENPQMFEPAPKSSARHPIFGALKDSFSIQPGWDLENSALDGEDLQALDRGVENTAALIERGLSRGNS